MKITLLLTGKTREAYLREGIDEYVKRLRRYLPFEIAVLPDIKASKKMEEKEVCRLEGLQLLKRVNGNDYVVLLDEKGSSFSSVNFAHYLASLEGKTGHTIFVVGGAYGFSEEMYARANSKLALSEMTFSHQMVRLIFVEQMYRAYTILNGEPYHHS